MSGWSTRLLLIAGIISLVLSISVDHLGLGKPGFGVNQSLLLLVGILLLLTGFLQGRRRNPPAAKGETEREDLPVSLESPVFVGFLRFYRAAALAFTNSLVALAFFNLLLFLCFTITDRFSITEKQPPSLEGLLGKLPMSRLAQQIADFSGNEDQAEATIPAPPALLLPPDELELIYPGMTLVEVTELLAEMRQCRYTHEAFTQFRELPVQGRYLNISAQGFREGRRELPWPMIPAAFNVWVFGGSTTLGYGLPDRQTIPAYLEAELEEVREASSSAGDTTPDCRVYNFGRGYYYSSQELALLCRLLREGAGTPDLAVFIDGINEHFQHPFFSRHLKDLMERGEADFAAYAAPESYYDPQPVIRRYSSNKRMIEAVARQFGIRTIFVWQPSPLWNYDLRHHVFCREGRELLRGGDDPLVKHDRLYQAMARRRLELDELGTANFLWLGDIQEGVEQPLYADRIHYTAAFSKTIAQRIAATMEE